MSKVLTRAPFTDYHIKEEKLNSFNNVEEYSKHAYEELNGLAKQNGLRLTLENNQEIKQGDQVIINIQCATCTKYDKKNLPITLGSFFYDKDLEELIPGMYVGQTTTATIGEHNVIIELLSATRREIPEIDDKLVKKAGIDNVSTVEEYVNTYVEEERTSEIMDYLFSNELMTCLTYAIDNSTFEINKFEMGAFIARRRESFEQAAEQEGMSSLEMLKGMFDTQDTKTEEELYKSFNDYLERDYKINLYALDYFKSKGKLFDLNSYEQLVVEAMRDHNISREEVIQTLPYDDYVSNYPFNELAQTVLPFLYQQAQEYLTAGRMNA